MSDNWLQFVPCDPEYQPSPQAAERACLLLLGFAAQAAVVSADFTIGTVFSSVSRGSCIRPICARSYEDLPPAAEEQLRRRSATLCAIDFVVRKHW
jgi:hypothetical protein